MKVSPIILRLTSGAVHVLRGGVATPSMMVVPLERQIKERNFTTPKKGKLQQEKETDLIKILRRVNYMQGQTDGSQCLLIKMIKQLKKDHPPLLRYLEHVGALVQTHKAVVDVQADNLDTHVEVKRKAFICVCIWDPSCVDRRCDTIESVEMLAFSSSTRGV